MPPRSLFVLAVLLAAAVPATAQTDSVPRVDDEELTRYARTHIVLSAAREAFHAELGRTNDAPGRARLRAEFEERLAEIHGAHGMTRERYRVITHAISFDEALRERFEARLAELSRGGLPALPAPTGGVSG